MSVCDFVISVAEFCMIGSTPIWMLPSLKFTLLQRSSTAEVMRQRSVLTEALTLRVGSRLLSNICSIITTESQTNFAHYLHICSAFINIQCRVLVEEVGPSVGIRIRMAA